MSDSMPRILLCAKPNPWIDNYLAVIGNNAVSCEVVETGDQTLTALKSLPYNGLILDVPTFLRNPGKEFLAHAARIFPSMWVTPASPLEQILIPFLTGPVIQFAPRRLREESREQISVSVRISRWNHDAGPGERAATLNLSRGGAFIVTGSMFAPGEKIFVTFPSASIPKPIQATVRWIRPWGQEAGAPGIGVEFCIPDSDAAAIPFKAQQIPAQQAYEKIQAMGLYGGAGV